MRNKFAQTGSYVTAAPINMDSGWIVMAMDDVGSKGIEHSAIMKWDRPMLAPRILKKFRTKYAAWLPTRHETVLVGDDGRATVIDTGGVARDESVVVGSLDPATIGDLRGGTRLGDEIIVVGMQRQVYRRTAVGLWVDMRQGLPPIAGKDVAGFEAVAAMSAEEIYAAGWDGEIWLYQAGKWQQIDSPTNRIITGLCAAGDGMMYGCGRNGMIIRGRGSAWSVLQATGCPDDLWSIASQGEQVFAASLQGLYELDGTALKLVNVDSIGATTFGVLVRGEGPFWSLGQKDVIELVNGTWSRVA